MRAVRPSFRAEVEEERTRWRDEAVRMVMGAEKGSGEGGVPG